MYCSVVGCAVVAGAAADKVDCLQDAPVPVVADVVSGMRLGGWNGFLNTHTSLCDVCGLQLFYAPLSGRSATLRAIMAVV